MDLATSTSSPSSLRPHTRIGPAAVTAASSLALRIVRGGDTGGEPVAITEPVSIGTATTNRIALTDLLVSRFHCEVAPSSCCTRG